MAQRERDRQLGPSDPSTTRARSIAWTALIVAAGVGAVFWLIAPPRAERAVPPDPDEGRDGASDPERSGRAGQTDASGADEPP
jgi:hypothetical protein